MRTVTEAGEDQERTGCRIPSERDVSKEGRVNMLTVPGWSSQMRTKNWLLDLPKRRYSDSLTRASSVEWGGQSLLEYGEKRK